MQPVTELTTSAEGHLFLTVRGAEGAVTVEAWEYEGITLGVLTVHCPAPHTEGLPPAPCPLGGECYPVIAWSAGFEAAKCLMRGERGLVRAEAIAYSRYVSRLCPDGVLS
jgi:hypothetical protein